MVGPNSRCAEHLRLPLHPLITALADLTLIPNGREEGTRVTGAPLQDRWLSRSIIKTIRISRSGSYINIAAPLMAQTQPLCTSWEQVDSQHTAANSHSSPHGSLYLLPCLIYPSSSSSNLLGNFRVKFNIYLPNIKMDYFWELRFGTNVLLSWSYFPLWP